MKNITKIRGRLLISTLLMMGFCMLKPVYAEDKQTLSYDQIKQAAESGDADAEYALGYMYFYGKSGVSKDVEQAKRWISKAAAHHQPQAERALELIASASNENNASNVNAATVNKNYANTPVQNAAPVSEKINTSVATKQEPEVALVNDKKTADKNKNYTLQLMGTRDKGKLVQMIQEQHLQSEAKIKHKMYKHKDWYVLMYGAYASKIEAQKAAEQLKHKLHVEPWIRSVSSLKTNES